MFIQSEKNCEAEWLTPTRHLSAHFTYSVSEGQQLRAAEVDRFTHHWSPL